MSKPTYEVIGLPLPGPALVSWAPSMCRRPWPCDCRAESPATDEATPETREGEFVGIINDIARAWRLRRSSARVQAIMDYDAAALTNQQLPTEDELRAFLLSPDDELQTAAESGKGDLVRLINETSRLFRLDRERRAVAAKRDADAGNL